MITLLISTLDELLKTRKGKRNRPTLEILHFNKRIGREIMDAAEAHRLKEYLGMEVPQRKSL